MQRLYCTCAPVWDYTGQEVARVGLFGHGTDDRPILTDHHRGVWELARRISMRLGLSAAGAREHGLTAGSACLTDRSNSLSGGD